MCTRENPCRILFIEDDEYLLRLLKAKAEHGDFMEFALESTTAPNIDIAAAILHETPKPFDVISLDLKMPGSEGIDTYNRIRSIPEAADIPIIVYSAFVDDRLLVEFRERGIERVITKLEWGVDQYVMLLHYAAGQYRARAREREQKRHYRKLWQEEVAKAEALQKKIPRDSEAYDEAKQLIAGMKEYAMAG